MNPLSGVPCVNDYASGAVNSAQLFGIGGSSKFSVACLIPSSQMCIEVNFLGSLQINLFFKKSYMHT